MRSAEPAFARYYQLVAALQEHYSQRMNIGAELPGLAQAVGLESELAVTTETAVDPIRGGNELAPGTAEGQHLNGCVAASAGIKISSRESTSPTASCVLARAVVPICLLVSSSVPSAFRISSV